MIVLGHTIHDGVRGRNGIGWSDHVEQSSPNDGYE